MKSFFKITAIAVLLITTNSCIDSTSLESKKKYNYTFYQSIKFTKIGFIEDKEYTTEYQFDAFNLTEIQALQIARSLTYSKKFKDNSTYQIHTRAARY